MLTLLLLLIFHFHFIASTGTRQLKVCTKNELFYSIHHSFNYNHISETKVFLFYDINPGEGFNLRRDVYIRLAVFMKYLRQQSGFERAHLVLPPFRRLYHWKSQEIDQSLVFWNHFFDLPSLKRYAPVLETWEYFDEIKRLNDDGHIKLDYSLTLQHYENMFENGRFIDRFEVMKSDKMRIRDNILGYKNVTASRHHTVLYQGSVKKLYQLLDELKPNFYQSHFSVLLNHAEIVLHDVWGNREFWRARRSMRFSNTLTSIADEFRLSSFNSTNENDSVQRPTNWEDERSHRQAIGGDYICAHVRRADFVVGREKTTPTLRSVVNQIKVHLHELDITKIFISSDCSRSEFKTLKSYLMRHKVYRYQPESVKQKNGIKDGGIAIIDQIICSHARYFIGTYESTFTYRIYEEREIMGFPKNSTFNTFCKTDDSTSLCELLSDYRRIQIANGPKPGHLNFVMISVSDSKQYSRVTQPIFLGGLISYYSGTGSTIHHAYGYAAAVILTSAINVVLMHPFVLGQLHCGMKIRVAVCSMIYRKALKLSKNALGDTTAGQVVLLMLHILGRSDVTAFELFLLNSRKIKKRIFGIPQQNDEN